MKLIPFLLFFLPLYGGVVRIHNDSDFDLTATIHSASGNPLGTIALPKETKGIWEQEKMDTSHASQTPYSVVFLCKGGSIYGTIDDVAEGAFISVREAKGVCYCDGSK